MEAPEEMVASTATASAPTPTAERLVEEAQAFSQEAWGHIYDQYYPKLLHYCYARTGNRTVSEDLASEVFLEALRSVRRYRYRGVPFVAWFYRIAHNLTADYLRRNARQPTVSLAAEAENPRLQSPDEAEASAFRQDVSTAIQQLTDDHQQVLTLRFFEGLSHEETAAVMGRRPGAVRALQSRALNALRRLMVA